MGWGSISVGLVELVEGMEAVVVEEEGRRMGWEGR